jgi:hypothetical protein
LRIRIPIVAGHRGGKAVPLPDYGFYESRLLGVIPQSHTDFADSGVDAVIDIKEDVLAPKATGNVIA